MDMTYDNHVLSRKKKSTALFCTKLTHTADVYATRFFPPRKDVHLRDENENRSCPINGRFIHEEGNGWFSLMGINVG